MIRKLFIGLVMSGLATAISWKTVESQEIRLEPPKIDRRGGVIRSARPREITDMPPVEMQSVAEGARRYSRPGIRTSILGANRRSMSRLTRQEPMRSRPRGIYELAAAQAGQGDPMQNSMAIQNGTIIQGEPIVEDEIYYEDGVVIGEDPCVNEIGYPYCRPYQLVSFADMEYFVGAQGFKSVPNLAESGSFGFNEGINWGFPMPVLPILSLSGQIGFRFTQTDFYGANMTDESRSQAFVTAGLSRRVDYGFQMGVAFDYLQDDWYYEGSFAQIRSDFALVGGHGNEIGFRWTSGVQDSSETVATGLMAIGQTMVTDFSPVDSYRFYYRQQWDQMRGGHVEAMGGFTENGDGLLGFECLIPIAERWSLNTDMTCLFPSAGTSMYNRIDESWNVGIGLTWYPKGLSTWSKLYHRPLFDVADNGTFMFQR